MENRKFIEDWFKLRFNKEPENDKAYFEEWVWRFQSGHPEDFMDSISLSIYNKLKHDRFNSPLEIKG